MIHGKFLGMYGLDKSIKFDKETFDRISNFAQSRGLKAEPTLFGVRLYKKLFIKRIVASLYDNLFLTISPSLFEEVGQEIYGLKK